MRIKSYLGRVIGLIASLFMSAPTQAHQRQTPNQERYSPAPQAPDGVYIPVGPRVMKAQHTGTYRTLNQRQRRKLDRQVPQRLRKKK